MATWLKNQHINHQAILYDLHVLEYFGPTVLQIECKCGDLNHGHWVKNPIS